MITFFNYFVKITGWLIQKIVFRTKIYYEDKKIQGRHIKKGGIIISNHTSVYDYACFLFVFFFNTLRYQMAEVLFKKKGLAWFLKCMGGIFVNRNSHDLSFLEKSRTILAKGGVVGIFPESRIPLEGESTPLPFKISVSILALQSDTKIIPIYTDGNYFTKKRARVIIGKPIYFKDHYKEELSEIENIEIFTDLLRSKIISLRNLLNEKI